jgi:hypothetical protein
MTYSLILGLAHEESCIVIFSCCLYLKVIHWPSIFPDIGLQIAFLPQESGEDAFGVVIRNICSFHSFPRFHSGIFIVYCHILPNCAFPVVLRERW